MIILQKGFLTMYITDERFFCEELDLTVQGLNGIDSVYKEQGLDAAEKQFADFVRGFLTPEKYFKIPYYGRENS